MSEEEWKRRLREKAEEEIIEVLNQHLYQFRSALIASRSAAFAYRMAGLTDRALFWEKQTEMYMLQKEPWERLIDLFRKSIDPFSENYTDSTLDTQQTW